MGILLIFFSSIFIAFSNFCMRKTLDKSGSIIAFLMIQLSLNFIVSVLLNPMLTNDYYWSSRMVFFGLAVGVVLALMMIFLGKSLETGPVGLSFASINSTSVISILLMVFIFGKPFEFFFSPSLWLGSFLIFAGLLWAGWCTKISKRKMRWAIFISTAFALHVLIGVLIQWRDLFVEFPGVKGLLLNFDVKDAKSQWFIPSAFFSAAIVQIIVYLITQKRLPNYLETIYGSLAGIAQGLGMFLMIWAIEISSVKEQVIAYPVYFVSTIFFCNLWAQWVYREKINWFASICCMVGIFIGTLGSVS